MIVRWKRRRRAGMETRLWSWRGGAVSNRDSDLGISTSMCMSTIYNANLLASGAFRYIQLRISSPSAVSSDTTLTYSDTQLHLITLEPLADSLAKSSRLNFSITSSTTHQ